MKSKFEETIYKQLCKLYGKSNVEYEPIRLPYVVNQNRVYIPDFVCSSDADVVVEAKGYFRPQDRAKMRLVKEQHPELDIRMVFQNDGKVGKRMRYSEWCERYGFPYSIGSIPRDWS